MSSCYILALIYRFVFAFDNRYILEYFCLCVVYVYNFWWLCTFVISQHLVFTHESNKQFKFEGRFPPYIFRLNTFLRKLNIGVSRAILEGSIKAITVGKISI